MSQANEIESCSFSNNSHIYFIELCHLSNMVSLERFFFFVEEKEGKMVGEWPWLTFFFLRR